MKVTQHRAFPVAASVLASIYFSTPVRAEALQQTSATSSSEALAPGAPSVGDAATTTQTPPPNSANVGAPNVQAEAPNTGEIVVTALRSGQNIQKAPAAITLIDGSLLEKQQVVSILRVQNLVPAARFSANANSTRIYIRGIGSALDYYWIPETTAVNYNGVYLPRFAIASGFYDLSNVQILPGPQGVLYGRSAGGGAVVISSNRPEQKQAAAGTFRVGNYGLFHFDGMLNTPMTDTLAVRGAVFVNKRNGYSSFNTNADDSFGMRGSALWRPTSDLSLFVWGSYFKQDGQPPVVQYIPFVAGGNAWYVPKNDPVTGLDNTTGAFDKLKIGIAGYELKYSFGDVTVENTGSYLRQTDLAVRKLVGNDQLFDNRQRAYTEALRVSSKTGSLDWIAGIDLYVANSFHDVRFGPHQFGNIFPDIKTRSYSVFGQGIYSVLDNLRVVGGARWSTDKLSLNGTGIACFATCAYPPITFDRTWRHVDLKVGVEYDVAPTILAYANVQTGYAPGTLNTYANSTLFNKEVKPQNLLAYTAGLKSSFFQRRVTLNLEGYAYRYRDLIITAFNTAIGQQSLYNAPRATIRGLQLTSTFKVTPDDTISANVAYTKGRYGHFIASPASRDLNGLQLVFTPTWTATVAYDHHFPIAGGAGLDFHVGSYISSSYWGTFDHTSEARQGSYIKSDASLTFQPASNTWSVGVWVNNLENTAVKTALTSAGYAPPYSGSAYIEPPRTFGATLGFKF